MRLEIDGNAWNRGFCDGEAGKPLGSCPYVVGTTERWSWSGGYIEGNALRNGFKATLPCSPMRPRKNAPAAGEGGVPLRSPPPASAAVETKEKGVNIARRSGVKVTSSLFRCHDALRVVDGLIKEGFTHIVDADLQAYFDTIPHDRLMERVEEKISDGRVLALLRGWLKADILKGTERWTPVQGSPQGAVISPLLANIYLDPLDKLMAAQGYRMVRYADDFVILCRTREDAVAALEVVRAWVAANGLTLHPTKTHVGDCRMPGQGFEFLGYRFEAGKRYVRKKSLTKLKDSIWDKTRRTRGDSLTCIIAELNSVLRGWFGYFKQAHPITFRDLDGFIRRRLRSVLHKQDKRSCVGFGHADHRRWPNAFFASLGLFALHTAWTVARQSR
jgi:RNA-directed DNA polymerase